MSYEEMLELGDKLGKVQKGFTQQEIESIPARKYMGTPGEESMQE